MKLQSRGDRGKQNAQGVRTDSNERSMKNFPWKNPLKGGYKDIAMAEVTMKGAGLFVGFKVRF